MTEKQIDKPVYRPPSPQEKRRGRGGGVCTRATDLSPAINFNSTVLDRMKFRQDFNGKMLKCTKNKALTKLGSEFQQERFSVIK